MKASIPPSDSSIDARKALLRRQFARYRAGLPEEEYRVRSDEITRRAIPIPELAAAEVVHVYWPILESREVDTRPLVYWLESMKKQIVMPVVRTFSRSLGERPRMTHVRFAGESGMRQNQWGVSEPSGSDTVPLERVDVVVVPALGAGRNGYRIGHGFGYYDEFLQGSTATLVCLLYDACLVDAVPVGRHDAPVNILVTEREVLRPFPT